MGESRFKNLEIWKLGMSICEEIYHVTDNFPRNEQFTLTSQMRRSALSIPSNIAEGYTRRNNGEKHQFFNVACASGAELETQLELSRRLGYLGDDRYLILSDKVDHVSKMITKFLKQL